MAGVIGIEVQADDAAGLVAGIVRAEELGIPAAWLITAPPSPDGLTVMAAAAARTSRIRIGSSITPSYPRHPIATAQQGIALGALAPGRIKIGVGSANKRGIEGTFGIPYERPIAHLGAYVKVLKGILQDGAIDLDEAGITAHLRLDNPPGIPILTAALRRRAFELSGEVADGAISWLCPPSYLRDVALPALQAGAARANRPAPPLVAQLAVCVSTDQAAVRTAARANFGFYTTLSTYQAMFASAGFTEAAAGEWSDAISDAVVISGDEGQVAERLRALLALGVDEIIATPIAPDGDPAAFDRALDLIGQLAKG